MLSAVLHVWSWHPARKTSQSLWPELNPTCTSDPGKAAAKSRSLSCRASQDLGAPSSSLGRRAEAASRLGITANVPRQFVRSQSPWAAAGNTRTKGEAWMHVETAKFRGQQAQSISQSPHHQAAPTLTLRLDSLSTHPHPYAKPNTDDPHYDLLQRSPTGRHASGRITHPIDSRSWA